MTACIPADYARLCNGRVIAIRVVLRQPGRIPYHCCCAATFASNYSSVIKLAKTTTDNAPLRKKCSAFSTQRAPVFDLLGYYTIPTAPGSAAAFCGQNLRTLSIQQHADTVSSSQLNMNRPFMNPPLMGQAV